LDLSAKENEWYAVASSLFTKKKKDKQDPSFQQLQQFWKERHF
jgi:hypothetical protein